MANNSLEINLNEKNDLSLTLEIKGSDKDIAGSKPKIRFAITENATGRGWLFDTEKNDSGDGIVVSIPPMKNLIDENKTYSGKLEVIMGTHYFVPVETEIEFIEPIKIEAAFNGKISSSPQETLKEEKEIEIPLSVESAIASVIIPEKPTNKPQKKIIEEKKVTVEEVLNDETPAPTEKRSRVSYSSLSEEQKKLANRTFLEACKKLGVDNPRPHLKEGTELTKRRLRALLAQSVAAVVKRG